MSKLAILVAVLLAAGDDPARPDPAKIDLEKLRGTWVMVSMETEGHDAAPEDIKDRIASYEGNVVTLRDGATIRKRGIVTLDPSRTPRAINTWDQGGPYDDQTVPGIYALEGDSLKLCFARPGEERPKEFTTRSGTGFLVCVYKRKPAGS